jgi:hypothetical protein
MATLTAATMLQREASHKRMVWAWGQTLFTEVHRVWGQLESAESLAYEDKVATQVHVLKDAAASLTSLSETLESTCHRHKQHLQSWRT